MATAVLMPRQGQSVESCILIDWKVKPGDVVKTGQPLAGIETDKATFEVESPADGAVLDLFFKEGDDIPVLTHIAAIGQPGEDVAGLRPGGESVKGQGSSVSERKPTEAPLTKSSDPRPSILDPSSGISPRARNLAARQGVDAAQIAGSGPGGRVLERDVKAAAAGQPRKSAAAREAVLAGKGFAPAAGSGPGGLVLSQDLQKAPAAAGRAAASPAAQAQTVPVKGVRKIIAERMKASLATTAQLTINRSFDATALQSFREKAKASGEPYGLDKITINDLIVFALSRTLANHPAMNAHFLGDRIAQFADVNLGIAIDTPRGLMVPVLAAVNRLPLRDLSAAIKQLAKSCQEGSINPDLLQGGTFTITNLGALGVESFTPVLNAPEVAILGVGGLWLKPVRTPAGVQHVDAITLSLTIDHQAVDGAPAARFLKDLCEALENIELLLASP